jgi:pimeloyl-ACP methyl ester carboxylesterase
MRDAGRAGDAGSRMTNAEKGTPMSRSIQLSTGVTVPYMEHGDPSGVPTILLHGYTDSSVSYELMLPHLPDSIHAYAYTQRGHGDADKPAAGYDVEDYVADVAAFMDAMGIEAAVIAGHSGGSYTAQRFAIEHPERTLGLVLIGAFRTVHDNQAVLELHEATFELTDPVDADFVREFQESCVAEPVPAGFMAEIVAGSMQVPARVWRDYLTGLIEADVPTDRGVIGLPTLIQWGDQDAICHRGDQDGLLAAIPGARLEVYRGAGHCPHWEQPERAAAEIAAFCLDVSRAPQRPKPQNVIS